MHWTIQLGTPRVNRSANGGCLDRLLGPDECPNLADACRSIEYRKNYPAARFINPLAALSEPKNRQDLQT